MTENKLVYVPETKSTSDEWGQSGRGHWTKNQAGNSLYTRLINALNKIKRSTANEGRVVEYELVPTGKIYYSESEKV